MGFLYRPFRHQQQAVQQHPLMIPSSREFPIWTCLRQNLLRMIMVLVIRKICRLESYPKDHTFLQDFQRHNMISCERVNRRSVRKITREMWQKQEFSLTTPNGTQSEELIPTKNGQNLLQRDTEWQRLSTTGKGTRTLNFQKQIKSTAPWKQFSCAVAGE